MPGRAKSTAPIPPGAIADAVIATLRSAKRPLPLSTLAKAIREEGLSITSAALVPVVDGLVEDGRIHEHPIARKTKTATRRFWNASPESYVDRVLAATIDGGGEWTESQLRKPVEMAYRELFDEAVGRLISAGRLYPSAKGGKTRRLQTSKPRPTEALTTAQRKSLEGILARVNAARRAAIRIDDLLAFLDGASVAGGNRAASTPEDALTPEMLMAFYAADLARREGLRSMPIPWTWRRYAEDAQRRGTAPDKGHFQRLLRELADAGRIALSRHDTPGRVAEDELAILERTPDGGIVYYWTPVDART
jgi:hypothetical protein